MVRELVWALPSNGSVLSARQMVWRHASLMGMLVSVIRACGSLPRDSSAGAVRVPLPSRTTMTPGPPPKS